MIFAHCSLYFGHLREKSSEKFHYRFCCHVNQCLTVRQQKNFQEVVYVRCLKWCKCRSGCSKVDPCGALRTTQKRNFISKSVELLGAERNSNMAEYCVTSRTELAGNSSFKTDWRRCVLLAEYWRHNYLTKWTTHELNLNVKHSDFQLVLFWLALWCCLPVLIQAKRILLNF